MKTANVFFVLVLALLTFGAAARGQLLVENFSYPPATPLNGQGGWSAHSGLGTNPPQITSGGLTYSGYASSGIGNAVSFTTTGEDNNRPYATYPNGTTSGSLYYALLVRIDSAGATGDYFFHLLKTSTTFTARLFVRRAANGNLRFGVGKSSTIGNINFSDSIYTPGTTYLIAVKYTVIPGATNDTVALWINPTPGGPEPAPTVLQSASDRATTDIDTLYAVALRQGTAANASIGVIDGIRVGTTWETVVAGIGTVKTINNTLPTGGDNYASFTDAINALNSGPVPEGGITFNVSAGQTFTENPPEITATGTSSNRIVFRRSGPGANPKIIPSTAGTVASSTTLGVHGDGILIINGGDFITFDGIDLQTDSTFTGAGMMEYGYYLKKASGDNACKNITIKNCTITLNKAAIYSFGIFVSNISGTTSVTVTSTGGRSENITLHNNTITNAYGGVQLRGFAAAAPYDFYDTNIEVGAPGNGNTINNYGGGATTVYGIYGIYQDSVWVRNNTISGGDGTTATHYGVFFSTAINSDIAIENNTISMTNSGTTSQMTAISCQAGTTTGTTNTQSIKGNTIAMDRPSVTTGVTYVLYFTTNYPLVLNIENNIISNITHASTGVFYGIYQISNPVNLNIRNNTISNISTNSSSLYGINVSSVITASNTEISGNTIHSLTTGGSAGIVAAINASTAMKYRMFKNNIYGLTSNGATGTAFGITKLGSSDTTYIYNNFISDLRAPSSTSTHAVAGLNVTATTAGNLIYVFYNTIYLNATSSSTTSFGSSGIFMNTGPTSDLRNNVVVNVSEPGPTGGATVAYRRSSATLTTYSSASNNNDFYVNPGAGVRRYFYGEGTTASVANADSTLAAYKARVAPRDANSVAENPPFINVGTPPYNLHINPALPTALEAGAIPITSPLAITVDFDGDTRHATTPDIGADEFLGTGGDITPPNITYTPLGNTTAGTVQTLSSTITDASGVPTTGIGRPVAYWKINSSGTYTGATGTYFGNNVFTFSFGAGTVVGDTVYYFVAAQDSLNNVGVFPSQGAGGLTANPPAASIPPTNPSSYLVLPVFAGGTYTVGTTSGTYATLKAAFDAMNNAIVTGNVTLSILNEGTSESATAQLNPVNYGAGGPYSVTIKPAANARPRIAGAIFRGGVIKLAGADNVTIDGSNTVSGTTRDLTIQNTATGFSTTVIWVGSLGANAGATNVTIKNCNLIATGNDSNNTSSIYVAAVDTITGSSTGAHNNNLVIENNLIMRGRYGVYTRGVAATGLQRGLIIRNNTMGSDSAGYEISYRAIDIGNADSALISGNTIFNIQQPQAFTATGIHVDANVTNVVISGNTIRKIHQTNTGTFGAIGININATTTSNIVIVNNMISDLRNDGGGTSTASNPFGIRIAGGTNHKVYYNSVSLADSFFNMTTTDLSAAFIVTVATATGLDMRNNIFSNSMTGGGTTTCYAIYAVSASTVFGTIDYNDYYVSGPNGILGRQGTTNVPDLAGWRTFTGQDLNSISANPLFINPLTNLHISTALPSPVDSAATPIAGITTDIDGDARHATRPDIGADEFSRAVLPAPTVSGVARSTRVPAAGDTLVVTATITDTLGISSANLIYNVNGVATAVPMVRTSGTPQNGTYRGVVPGSANANGNRIEYQIQANSLSGLTTTTPIVRANSYYAGISPLSLTGLRRMYPDGRIIDSLYYARVTGTVNGPNFQTTNLGYHFQDAVGGIQLFSFGILIPPLNPGDSIIVLGRIAQFRGLTEIIPDTQTTDIQVVATGRPVNPVTVRVPVFAANPELYESRLVRIDTLRRRDATPPWPGPGTSANIVMYQHVVTDTIIMRVDSDTEIPGSPEPTYPVNVTGVITQFSSATNVYNNGYQTQPRYRTDLQIVVGVDESEGIPKTFDLAQNYPNPFNPSTQIKYALAKESFVTLKVYNILGQEVVTLLNEQQKAAYMIARWNGCNGSGNPVGSGIYFYRLEARPTDGSAPFISTKKMIVVK